MPWQYISCAIMILMICSLVVLILCNISINALRDIALNAFMDKYKERLESYLNEAANELRKKNYYSFSHSRFYNDTKNPLIDKAVVRLKQDMKYDPEFASETKSIIRLYGKKSIYDILYYILNTNSINADPIESTDSYSEDHRRITYTSTDEEKMQELYNEGLPNEMKPDQDKVRRQQRQTSIDYAGVDPSKLDASNLDPKFREIVDSFYDNK